MQKSKILVLGYFAYEYHQIGGQISKTRNVYNLLAQKEAKYNYTLEYFDTQSFKKNKWNILKMFRKISKCDKLVYIAAHGNLKYLFPIIFLISKLLTIEIHYIVVGGWLDDFIKNKPIHIRFLRKINGIYPQTNKLTTHLKEHYNFTNVFQLQNFRIVDNDLKDSKKQGKTDPAGLRLVFMGHVFPKKGVDTIFLLEEELTKVKLDNIQIDIYGPLDKEYEVEFKSKLKLHPKVNYKGFLKPSQIHATLKNYDLMLFPTKYYTEGFPGSILDAYISDIPVVATNWEYANEFINHDVCGLITDFDNEEVYIREVIKLLKNPSKIETLKLGIPKQLQKYSSESAWKVLHKRIVTFPENEAV